MLFHVSFKSYVPVSVMLFSQDRIIKISTSVKFEINNLAFTLKVLKVNPNEKELNYTVGLCNNYIYISSFVAHRVILTEASDLKLFVGGVIKSAYISCQWDIHS